MPWQSHAHKIFVFEWLRIYYLKELCVSLFRFALVGIRSIQQQIKISEQLVSHGARSGGSQPLHHGLRPEHLTAGMKNPQMITGEQLKNKTKQTHGKFPQRSHFCVLMHRRLGQAPIFCPYWSNASQSYLSPSLLTTCNTEVFYVHWLFSHDSPGFLNSGVLNVKTAFFCEWLCDTRVLAATSLWKEQITDQDCLSEACRHNGEHFLQNPSFSLVGDFSHVLICGLKQPLESLLLWGRGMDREGEGIAGSSCS